jgi:hypothetical protein
MSYEYEVFLSYARSQTDGQWVRNHFAQQLEYRLNDVTRDRVRISWDHQMESGVSWPDELKRRLRCSRLLVAVWSPEYFRSAWCMAEWRSFRERELKLGLFNVDQPRGLIYPIRYSDGEHFHSEAQRTQCKKDFSSLNYPFLVFQKSEKFLDFDDLVRDMASEIAQRLNQIPTWRDDFPIVEPEPLPAAVIDQPPTL